MTKEKFHELIHSQGNCIYFNVNGDEYNIGYIPVQFEDKTWGYERIGICNVEVAESLYNEEDDYDPYTWFKTADDMLEQYLIDGVPLEKHLCDIQNMRGIPCG